MSTFDDRERGFESKFAHDQDLEFKALAKRNRLLGLWAGHLMDLEDPALENYATAVIKYEVAHPGEEAILRKVAQDLVGSGLKVTEDQVRGKMDELLAIARGEVQAEG